MQVGLKLMKSRRKDDVTLGKAFVEELVADVREVERERAEKEARDAQKAAEIEALREAGRSRSMRQRKPVCTCPLVLPGTSVFCSDPPPGS